MESKRFTEILRSAIAGEPDALETILWRLLPTINARSKRHGRFDEDLRQYIIMRIIMEIPKFDPDYTKPRN